MPILLALAAALPAPGGEPPREYGDWLVWCATGEPCTAELAPRTGPPTLALSLRPPQRRRTPAALVVVPPATLARGARARLTVDGKILGDLQAPGNGGGLALPLDKRFGPMLRNGRLLTLTSADGAALGSASLSGMAAALADVSTGHPPAPPAPIVAPVRGDKAPRTLSTKVAAKLIPTQPCATLPPGVGRAVRLDARASLALVTAPCGDDFILQPLIVDEKGRTRLADIDDAPAITKADWDALQHRLVLTEATEPDARCTAERRYVWNGARFALAERAWQCAGRAAPIVTWRATVVER